VADCLKSLLVSELPIEFRAFDRRHHVVFVCDKGAGFKQAIPLIRRLLLIDVGHGVLCREISLGLTGSCFPILFEPMVKWQRHRAIRKRKREERYESVRGRDAQRLPGVKDAHCMKN
jgi:hypothetical protein